MEKRWQLKIYIFMHISVNALMTTAQRLDFGYSRILGRQTNNNHSPEVQIMRYFTKNI